MKKNILNLPRAMKKLYALTEKRPIDVSLSENPLGCSPMVSSALKQMRVDFNDYPSPNGKKLRKKLSEKFLLNIDNFFVANGSESIINDLPKVFCTVGDEVIIPKLTFPMFAVCSELAGLNVLSVEMTDDLGVDLEGIINVISDNTKMIFLCNPNNPTGSVLPKNKIMQFINQVPKNVLVVVDEANIEFGGKSVIGEIGNQKNLIVLRTLSKGFGLATLRIGFMVANQNIIQKLEEETPIFQISGISEQLACVALDDDEFIQRTREVTAKQRLFLQNKLTEIGFTIFPSEANNLFAKIPNSLSEKQFVKKLSEKGISVVIGSNFDGFDDSFFRVSIRDEVTNQKFIQKIEEIMKEAM
ncbi:MAG: histidinol-phosphate aminotransferase family protein [Pseudomonadales bacterium]|nr:histidinol-phosphate aminotransferase family protein [Pseudomonadales bacterium]